MRVPRRITRHAARRAVIALLAVVSFAATGVAAAQSPRPRSDTLSTRVRDSIIADVLADTVDLSDDALPLILPEPGLRQSVTIRPTYRRYAVGKLQAIEEASSTSWVGRFRRAALRVDLTPLTYKADTSTNDRRPSVAFGGVTPVSLRLDLQLRSRDTLRLFAQSTSSPGALSAAQAQAIGAVGTSTLDLDAGSLGITARAGLRYAFTQPLGDGGVSLSVRTGAEYDPKPSGADVVSWRGTTLRGLLGVTHASDDMTLGASVELTRSFTDSLGGRNLFPGGGLLTAEARLLRYLGSDGVAFITLNGFYARPVDIERPDVPTRLIPIGDFSGVTATAAIPVGVLTVLPMVSVLRESSEARATISGVPATLDASGTTGSASLGVAVPIGRFVTVTPEVGGAVGSVGQTVSARFPRRTRTQSFSDPIRGGWVTIEVSIRR